MGDQRLDAGGLRLGMGGVGLCVHASGPLGEDHRMRGGEAGGKIGDA